jgi:mannose-6-phosphate isomerase class I
VDKAQYTIRELTRAALKDVGRFICKKFRDNYYSHFKRRKGRVGKYTQYWVKNKQKEPELLVGIKSFAFYGGFQELGSSKNERLGLLTKAAQDNINTIIEIESQYLSALEDEAKALSLISENDYEGDADG